MIRGSIKFFLVFISFVFVFDVWAVDGKVSNWSEAAIESMRELYGLGREGAVVRLNNEAAAADVYRRVNGVQPKGYAGSWFDPESGSLRVALSEARHESLVRRMGGSVQFVKRSLEELDQVRAHIRIVGEEHPGLIAGLGVDFRLNRVRVGVLHGDMERASELLDGLSSQLVIDEVSGEGGFSSGPVWGSFPTLNYTWSPVGGYTCSVGLPTEGGYLTVGHCGYETNDIRTPGLVQVGVVGYSSFNWGPSPIRDIGWVELLPGWVPQPEIRGSGGNTWYVPSKWSGTNESPIGSTVCRFGMTSSGPHCGTLVYKDYSVTLDGQPVEGLSVLTGSCSDDGDSGGPHIALAGNQVQGVNVGGDPKNSCPSNSTNEVYFQPIGQVIERVTNSLNVEKPMLTYHGALPPAPYDLRCPNLSNSGNGFFWCDFQYFDSQGVTTVNWSSSLGGASSSTHLAQSCSPNHPVTVAVVISNPYGAYNQTINFICPDGIIP